MCIGPFLVLIDAEIQIKNYIRRNFSNCTCLTPYVKCDFNKQIFATGESSQNVVLTDHFFALKLCQTLNTLPNYY